MKIHDLKCWPEPFEATRLGAKTMEVRRDGPDFQAGDVLRLREWDPAPQEFSGRLLHAKVTEIMRLRNTHPLWGLNSSPVVVMVVQVLRGAP